MSIKNFIEYYYNIKITTLHKNHKEYTFDYKNNQYLFLPTLRYEQELLDIHSLIKNYDYYDQIIFNIENKILTPVYNKNYVLFRKTKKPQSIENIIINSVTIMLNQNLTSVDRSNWVLLWSEKIDYIEYQQLHLDKEYPILRDSINYFIGMSENAISYVYNTYNYLKTNNMQLVISHKRIKKEKFNNPLNLIVDYKSRDVAEYLKFLFLTNNYDYLKINQFIRSLHLNQISYQLIFGRMLFPTYYFDLYDQIVNNRCAETEILNIIKRVDEYEDYLTNIYMIINNISAIERVNWL